MWHTKLVVDPQATVKKAETELLPLQKYHGNILKYWYGNLVNENDQTTILLYIHRTTVPWYCAKMSHLIKDLCASITLT